MLKIVSYKLVIYYFKFLFNEKFNDKIENNLKFFLFI